MAYRQKHKVYVKNVLLRTLCITGAVGHPLVPILHLGHFGGVKCPTTSKNIKKIFETKKIRSCSSEIVLLLACCFFLLKLGGGGGVGLGQHSTIRLNQMRMILIQ